MKIKSFITVGALLLPTVFSHHSVVWAAPSRLLPSAPKIAGFPFSDGFEGEALGANWSSSVTGEGVVKINTDYPHSGSKHVFVGQEATGDARADLILAIDLSGKTDVVLDFWWRASGAARNTEDGVYISDNEGASWTRVYDLYGRSPSYSRAYINISAATAANSLALNNKFQIRIRYEAGNLATNTGDPFDGLVIDDLKLDVRSSSQATSLLQEDFEIGIFSQGFYPQSTGVGTTQINEDYPSRGTKSLFVGQKAGGIGTADLILIVNLSGKTDVTMDFWWRASGFARNGNDGVYISADEGTNWTKVYDLFGQSPNYGHAYINIASAASANALALNSKFQIRIRYDSGSLATNGGDPEDGLVIDDLRMNTRSTNQATFPLQDDFESGIFVQGLYPQNIGAGATQINSDYAFSGNKSVFLGQKAGGNNAIADLVLVADLANQKTVYLDFWWRASGFARNASDGIYISDNEGATWTKIIDLFSGVENFNHVVVDLAKASSANGRALNSKFQIRFRYKSGNFATGFGNPNDGIIVDNIRLGANNPEKSIYLPFVRK